jgi:hypothetical protein
MLLPCQWLASIWVSGCVSSRCDLAAQGEVALVHESGLPVMWSPQHAKYPGQTKQAKQSLTGTKTTRPSPRLPLIEQQSYSDEPGLAQHTA